jgi:uncharacterized DUF497 family protein
MTFEYDEDKSEINKTKHGIDFEKEKELWKDPYAFEIPSLQSEDEERFLVLGQIDKKNWTAIITYRKSNVRIISVRRSRAKEVKLYESIRNR